MFGNAMFGDYEDPFFSAHQQQMQRMDAMFRDPFGMMNLGQPTLALTDGGIRQRQAQHGALQAQAQQQQMMPRMGGFGLFGDMFGQMNQMMSGMQQQMSMAQSDPNSQFYSSSTMMSFDNTGGGQPRVYQASSSTTKAGDVKFTKKSVRDSATGVQKMSVGRHIGDKAHTITKEKNARTGDEEENVDFVNLDEEEAGEFDQEWQQRTRTHQSGRSLGAHRRQHDRPRAITDGHIRSPYDRYTHPAAEGAAPRARPAPNHQSSPHVSHTSAAPASAAAALNRASRDAPPQQNHRSQVHFKYPGPRQ